MATNDQVITHFIMQSSEPIDGSSLFVQDGVLYSYGTHWPLAVWDTANDCVWLNSTKRSVTSSRHLNLVTAALTQHNIKFTMKHVNELKELINAA